MCPFVIIQLYYVFCTIAKNLLYLWSSPITMTIMTTIWWMLYNCFGNKWNFTIMSRPLSDTFYTNFVSHWSPDLFYAAKNVSLQIFNLIRALDAEVTRRKVNRHKKSTVTQSWKAASKICDSKSTTTESRIFTFLILRPPPEVNFNFIVLDTQYTQH